MIDCEEHLLQQRLLKRGHVTGRVDDNINAVAARISFFKEKTLPAIKHFDDKGKVIIVSQCDNSVGTVQCTVTVKQII